MSANLLEQGQQLYSQEKFSEAEACFRGMLAHDPDDVVAFYNLGVVLARQDRFQEAVGCLMAALERNPGMAAAYNNLGFCLNELGFIERAKTAFQFAQQVDPTDPKPVLNEGIAQLALGDFRQGWKNFEARRHMPSYLKHQRDFGKKEWRGEDAAEKIIVLHAEEGFGDTIQMARYIPLLQKRCKQLIVEVPRALVRLFQGFVDVQIIAKGDAWPGFDLHCPMLSLPLLFDTVLETIPAEVPYLRVANKDIAAWDQRLPAQGKKRIGVVWAGRPTHERDRSRSLEFKQLAPLLARQDFAWVNLQRVIPERDKDMFTQMSLLLKDGELLSDFYETAAAIMNCDLVIPVDTSVAHLAAALGKPVWIMLAFFPDWRWMLGRDTSPWYPTVRLFRQPSASDWGAVIEQIAGELERAG